MVKVSVIVVTYNCVGSIESSLRKIIRLKARYKIELVVVDGHSTDGTAEILHGNEAQIDKLLIEPDKGIYDAMNKGIRLATGDFFIFVGADDELLDIPEKSLELALRQGYQLVAGCVRLKKGVFKSFFSWKIHFANTIHHQSLFYSKALPVRFNTDYRVFADFDLNQKFYKNKVPVLFIDDIITRYNEDGVSGSGKHNREYVRVIRGNFGAVWGLLSRLYLVYFRMRNGK